MFIHHLHGVNPLAPPLVRTLMGGGQHRADPPGGVSATRDIRFVLRGSGGLARQYANPHGGEFYFLYTLGNLAKRGGGWLPSGAIEGCYPPGMLELSEILILVKNPSPKRRLSVNNSS